VKILTWVIVAALIALFVGAAVDTLHARNGKKASVARPSTAAATSTSAQTDATDANGDRCAHVAEAGGECFGDLVNDQVQRELEAMTVCLHRGGDHTACVDYHRQGYLAAVREGVQALTTIVRPETGSDRCYRRLVSFRRVISELRAGSEALVALAESGRRPELRDFESKATTAAKVWLDAGHRAFAACVPPDQ